MPNDIREYLNDIDAETLEAAIRKHQAHIWISLPCVVANDTADGHTCTLQPAIKGTMIGQDGKVQDIAYPMISDVPIHHPQGGANVHTMPVKAGDEVIAFFASRPIDSWHQSGGTDNKPIDRRVHHMSDAFCVHGVRSDPRKLANVSNKSSQVRAVDGSQVADLHPVNGHTLIATDPKDQSKKHTITVNKDAGIASNSSQQVQAVVAGSSSTITSSNISHVAGKIFLNCV